MKGTWRLKLRMLLTSVLMFTIVYFLIFLVGRYLGISSWRLYAGVSLVIVFLQYWFGPSLVKRSMNVRPLSEAEAPHIHQMVQELADAAGVPKPKIGLSEINIPNAFAYGRTSRSGHIAITRPILGLLDRDELKAVLGHEMSHVSNGDMVTMGLVQGITNTFVYALSYVLASVLSAKAGNSRSSSNSSFYLFSSVFQVVFGFLATAVVMWFSRWREFHADAGAAKVYGSQAMINALLALQNNSRRAASMSAREANSRYRRKSANMNALCISVPSNIRELFASHPSIERRIEALKKLP